MNTNNKGKNRIAFLLSFLFKFGIIVLFFLINGTSKAEARLSEASMFHNDEAVLIQTENSGSCSYEELPLGKIDLNVNANEHFGDVIIQVTINNITYGDSYDKAVVGEYIDEFQDLVVSKDGPWDLGIRYALECKSLNASLDDSYYYDIVFAGKNYTNKVIEDGATTRSETDLITVDNTSNLIFTIKLGSEANSTTLPIGSYCLHISLTRGELVGSKALDIGINRVIKLAFLSYCYAFLHSLPLKVSMLNTENIGVRLLNQSKS